MTKTKIWLIIASVLITSELPVATIGSVNTSVSLDENSTLKLSSSGVTITEEDIVKVFENEANPIDTQATINNASVNIIEYFRLLILFLLIEHLLSDIIIFILSKKRKYYNIVQLNW